MSENHTKINYEFLDSAKNFIYEARETGKTHSSFQYELMLFYSIRNGDIDGVRKALDLYKESGLIIGHMSDNQSREIHYWAVATIAVAIHYAILGGLDESEAYQLSDQYIQELNSHPSFPFCKRVSHFESDLQILYPTFHFCNDFPVFFLAFMI